MWFDHPTPIVIAHRGDSAHAPENTLAAFQLALDKGAPAIEFDVKLSRDDQVIVLHDQTVDRTTDGHGDVRQMTLAALKTLDAGARFQGKYAGERIPTLEEVFSLVGRKMLLNIELTNYATPRDQLAARVVELVKRHDIGRNVLFSSFYRRNLHITKALLPDIPCGLLAWKGILGLPARRWGWKRHLEALHPHSCDVNACLVEQVHACHKRMHVWTVNKPDDMKRLLALGVDGIFTDDPALLLAQIRGGT